MLVSNANQLHTRRTLCHQWFNWQPVGPRKKKKGEKNDSCVMLCRVNMHLWWRLADPSYHRRLSGNFSHNQMRVFHQGKQRLRRPPLCSSTLLCRDRRAAATLVHQFQPASTRRRKSCFPRFNTDLRVPTTLLIALCDIKTRDEHSPLPMGDLWEKCAAVSHCDFLRPLSNWGGSGRDKTQS